VLRRSERRRSFLRERRRSRRLQSAIRARDVRAADLQQELTKRVSREPIRDRMVSSDPTKTAAPRRTSQRAERAIRYSELGERGNLKGCLAVTPRLYHPGGNGALSGKAELARIQLGAELITGVPLSVGDLFGVDGYVRACCATEERHHE